MAVIRTPTRLASLAVAGIMFLFGLAPAHAVQVGTGSSVTFSVSVNGAAPFTYQWSKGGTPISAAISSTYTIVSAQVGDSGTYSVTVSNVVGSTISDTGTISVQNLVITTDPQSQSVAAGASVTLSAVAAGSPAPTYQWQKNNVNISGATSTALTLANFQSGDAATYTLVASNTSGSVTSAGAVLTLMPPTPPTITTQPITQTVSTGASVTLTVVATGSPVPTYQWKKSGSNISGANAASLTFSNLQLSDAGTYTLVATNTAGSATSMGAVLTVQSNPVAPAIVTQPQSQSVSAGAAVTLTAAVSGSPTPSLQWKKNGTNVSGANSTSFSFASIQTSDAGTYTLVATNSAGTATSSGAVLTISASTFPTITTQPVNQTVVIGASVTLTAAASGSPAPAFQWKKSGVNISGATSASLTLTNVQLSNAGTYNVVATNTAGSATSSGATLTVNAPTVPSITLQPVSQSVMPGASVTFSAAASGAPSPVYQWQKNGANISGATNATLTISGVQVSNAGTYRLAASNSVGSVNSNTAILTVNAAPTITASPLGQTTPAGTPVTFTVIASGTPAPTYQWYRNGLPIAGATGSSYSIASTTVGDAGTYTVVVTNTLGSVTSSGGVLVILESIPVITFQPASQTALVGSPVTFTVTVSGTPAPTFQWQKNGVNISGATGNAYAIANVAMADGGNYSVIVTNASGSVASNPATLTVFIPPMGDLNGDGQTDILWENVTSGDRGMWIMSGTVPVAWINLPAATLDWHIAGTGDFSGDGQTDILLQNSVTGQRKIWLMNGVAFGSEFSLGVIGTDWTIAATGDFNGDGRPDILWENAGSGARAVWIMNGMVPAAWINLPSIDLAWRIVGTGDFNGDGQPDILWENVGSGDRGMWIMSGTVPVAWINLPSISLNWEIAGTGDFNSDGQADILWENVSSGDRGMWIMSGTVPAAWINLPPISTDWRIVE